MFVCLNGHIEFFDIYQDIHTVHFMTVVILELIVIQSFLGLRTSIRKFHLALISSKLLKYACQC